MLKNFILVFILGITLSANSQGADYQILIKLQESRTTNQTTLNKGLSKSMLPISILTPICHLAFAKFKKDTIIFKNGLQQSLAFAFNTISTLGLKYIANRNRPYQTYPQIINLEHTGPYSFPSGHTSSAFATATSLSLNYKKWYVAVPAFAWAGGVAYSRMYLGVHYPTDVLAGAAMGIVSAFASYRINQWFYKKIK